MSSSRCSGWVALLFIRIVKTGNQKLWIWFGILAGLGLENKYSMLMFGAGMVFGMLLTSHRSLLTSPWLWIAGAISFLIFLPNLLWNIQHHFPFLELQNNIRHSGHDVPRGPLAFFGQEILSMHPLTLPVWLAGLWFYFSRSGKEFRALGWAWVFVAAVIVTLSPRVYHLFPAFPLLLAAGAVLLETWLKSPQFSRWKLAWIALTVVTSAILAPFAIPVPPPEMYIRYTRALHLAPPND